MVLVGAIVYLLFMQLVEFSNEWQPIRAKLIDSINQLSAFITDRFNVSAENQLVFVKNSINNYGSQAFSMLQSTIYSFSETFFFLLIIPISSILILYNRQVLVAVLYKIFPSDRKKTIHEILVETIHTYYNFMKGMALVYFIVGLLNSIGLLIIGVPHPFLFGFITSILTFIPYVGIIIASLFPIVFSWITYNSIWYPIAVIGLFTFVQYLEANLIFPMAVSSRLKINTFVTIIMIILGGIIWGAAGMILFIPFIAILKLIADNSEDLKMLSVFLGTKNK